MTRRMTGLPSRSIHSRFVREKEEGGGGKDEDNDDEGIDVEEDDDDEEDDDEADEDASKPFVKDDGSAFTKKDFDALNEALKKARRDARAAKRSKTPASKDADEKITAETKKWQSVVIKQSAKLALKDAGLQGAPDKLLKLLDIDDIEVDDDGEVDGLTEQIDELKKDYPELFAKKRRGIDAGDKDGKGSKEKLTPSEIQAKQMRGEM